MIIKGGRRGGAGQLASHLLRRDTNEDVHIREISNYPAVQLDDKHLRDALRLMETQAMAKGKHRTLYHSILAPQQGETLNQKQLKYAVDTLANNLGMCGHQRIVVEHKKDGRQHFHVVFNIVNPATGKLARLQWTRKIQWNTARLLEQRFHLKPVVGKGRPARRWECERGKRSGIDPLTVRKEVSAIYLDSQTGKEFIANLAKAGYAPTRGRNGSYVLVDKTGDIHGLMRRIEGAKLKDLRQKFPDLVSARLPALESVLKERKTQRPLRRPVGKMTAQGKRAPRITAKPRSIRLSSSKPHRISTAPAFHKPTRPMLRSRNNLSALLARISRPAASTGKTAEYYAPIRRRKKRKRDQNMPDSEKMRIRRPEMDAAELLTWAWENGRLDVLALFGIYVAPTLDD